MMLSTVSRKSCEYDQRLLSQDYSARHCPALARFIGDMLVTIERNSIGNAATAEIGTRGSRDEEEGMWPLHNLYRLRVSLGAGGSVKTVVHLINQSNEYINRCVGR